MILFYIGFVDNTIEPILWFICSAIFLLLGMFFLNKLIKSEKEARPFFAGVMIFFVGWSVARILETVRRYYVGYYYDIVDSNFHIYGVNLVLRLSYIIISYASVASLFYTLEDKIFNKRSYFILTIATIFEIVVGVLVYFNLPTLILTIIFFFIVGLFPIILFFYFGITNFVDKGRSWFILSLGLLLFVLGVAGDNPEGYNITKYIDPLVIHYGTPILAIIGMILIGTALIRVYRET